MSPREVAVERTSGPGLAGVLPGGGSVERRQLEGPLGRAWRTPRASLGTGQWGATEEEKEYDLCFRKDPGFHG